MPKITPFLWFDDQAEQAVEFYLSVFPDSRIVDVDRYWDALGDGGEEIACGWLEDRFGLRWQVVPSELPTVLGDPDPARSQRAVQAMLSMKKLDLDAIKRAADGGG